jgi:DNA primase
VNVIDLARKFVELKKVASTKGGEYVGACPGCGGTDRFHVWPEQKNGEGSWWCRGCNKGGDGIQFLIEFEGKTFPEACEALDKPLPDEDRFKRSSWQPNSAAVWKPSKATAPEGVDVKLWKEKAGKFVEWAHEKLMANSEQFGYLAGRGIRKETVVKYRLGYNPGEGNLHAFFRPRESWGLPKEVKESGKPKKLWIPRGIVIPYLQGEDVLRIRIRRDGEDMTEKFSARYYVVPGSTMAPMLVGPERQAYVIIETELDAALLDQEAGDLTGVLAMGSAAAKPDDATYQVLKESLCILNALDFDRAGYGAWKWWEEQFIQAERWPVPIGTDPGEAFEQGVDLRDWVLAGLPPAFSIEPGHAGPSLLDSEEWGATNSGVPAAEKSEMPEDAPESLKELFGLLQRLPVKIRVGKDRLSLVEKMGFQNWEESKRVSELVFMDPDVFAYITGHPAGVVHAGNFWEGLCH